MKHKYCKSIDFISNYKFIFILILNFVACGKTYTEIREEKQNQEESIPKKLSQTQKNLKNFIVDVEKNLGVRKKDLIRYSKATYGKTIKDIEKAKFKISKGVIKFKFKLKEHYKWIAELTDIFNNKTEYPIIEGKDWTIGKLLYLCEKGHKPDKYIDIKEIDTLVDNKKKKQKFVMIYEKGLKGGLVFTSGVVITGTVGILIVFGGFIIIGCLARKYFKNRNSTNQRNTNESEFLNLQTLETTNTENSEIQNQDSHLDQIPTIQDGNKTIQEPIGNLITPKAPNTDISDKENKIEKFKKNNITKILKETFDNERKNLGYVYNRWVKDDTASVKSNDKNLSDNNKDIINDKKDPNSDIESPEKLNNQDLSDNNKDIINDKKDPNSDINSPIESNNQDLSDNNKDIINDKKDPNSDIDSPEKLNNQDLSDNNKDIINDKKDPNSDIDSPEKLNNQDLSDNNKDIINDNKDPNSDIESPEKSNNKILSDNNKDIINDKEIESNNQDLSKSMQDIINDENNSINVSTEKIFDESEGEEYAII